MQEEDRPIQLPGGITMSAETDQLSAALAKAQGDLENVTPNSNNPAFRSRYADLGSVLSEVRPKLAEHGIGVIQAPSVNGEGTMMLSLSTTLLHESGQWISTSGLSVEVDVPRTKDGRPAQTLAQCVGSNLTYLRRYALAAVVGVSQADDDGNSGGHGRGGGPQQPRRPQQSPPPPPQQQQQRPPQAAPASNDQSFKEHLDDLAKNPPVPDEPGYETMPGTAGDGPVVVETYPFHPEYDKGVAPEEGKYGLKAYEPLTPGAEVVIERPNGERWKRRVGRFVRSGNMRGSEVFIYTEQKKRPA